MPGVYSISLAARALSRGPGLRFDPEVRGRTDTPWFRRSGTIPAFRRRSRRRARRRAEKRRFASCGSWPTRCGRNGRIDFKSRTDRGPSDRTIELSIQYSSRYTLSIASSLQTFIPALLCRCSHRCRMLHGLVCLLFSRGGSWRPPQPSAGWGGGISAVQEAPDSRQTNPFRMPHHSHEGRDGAFRPTALP